jgi:hypothetical protein
MSNEKGIRLKSGAVPAAVSPLMVSDQMPLSVSRRMGRFRKPDKPEDLPRFTTIFFAFGKNSKDELQFIVIHFLY